MQLIYRAQIFECPSRPLQPYCKPRAVNWRFQIPGETYCEPPISIAPYHQPRALNWRFQMAARI